MDLNWMSVLFFLENFKTNTWITPTDVSKVIMKVDKEYFDPKMITGLMHFMTLDRYKAEKYHGEEIMWVTKDDDSNIKFMKLTLKDAFAGPENETNFSYERWLERYEKGVGRKQFVSDRDVKSSRYPPHVIYHSFEYRGELIEERKPDYPGKKSLERIRDIETNIDEWVKETRSLLCSHLEGHEKVKLVLLKTIDSPKFQEIYEEVQTEVIEKKLHTRHDTIHVLRVTMLAVQLCIELWKKHQELFKLKKYELSDVLLVIGLACLWHDCGYSEVGSLEEKHPKRSWEKARYYIDKSLDEYGISEENKGYFLNAIEYAILNHSGGKGKFVEKMEAAIVRVADGLDCTTHRIGGSGLKADFKEYFIRGQALHIGGKVPIKDVKLNYDGERIVILVDTVPEFTPINGDIFGSILFNELNMLREDKIDSLGAPFSDLFHIRVKLAVMGGFDTQDLP